MIRVIFYRDFTDSGKILGFKSEGHAGYAASGKDIVCAAVSALVINTVNAIETLTDAECEVTVDEKQTVISMRVLSKQNNESLVLLKALELGLTEIAKDNSQYISITFEEV